MQTFLPYKDFKKTARVLDRQRLGKQRVETMQVMNTLTKTTGAWSNHPAVHMWKGYAWALLQYQKAIINEWVNNRGYKDTCLQKTYNIYKSLPDNMKGEGKYPPWLGREDFHNGHKSNLVRKKPEYYRKFWPNISENLEYVWPEASIV